MKKIVSVILCISLLVTVLSFTTNAQKMSNQKLVAITFDDGPSQYTETLLDGLKRLNAKATFFMVGENISYHSDIVKRMKEEGHQLATHTMDHSNLSKLSAEGIRNKVGGVNDLLTKLVGEGDYWLRPPYGAFNATVKATVETPMVYWSLDTLDWKSRNTEKVCAEIDRYLHDGDIILLHDLYETSVKAALISIEKYQKEGYTFVTVEQLLKRRGIPAEKGKVYFNCPNKGITLPAVTAPTISVRQTVLGTKVIIGKSAKTDTLFFTQDGKEPTKESEQYISAFYVKENESVKAIAVSEDDISDISEQSLTANDAMSKDELDRMYDLYAIPFVKIKTPFIVGMKS